MAEFPGWCEAASLEGVSCGAGRPAATHSKHRGRLLLKLTGYAVANLLLTGMVLWPHRVTACWRRGRRFHAVLDGWLRDTFLLNPRGGLTEFVVAVHIFVMLVEICLAAESPAAVLELAHMGAVHQVVYFTDVAPKVCLRPDHGFRTALPCALILSVIPRLNVRVTFKISRKSAGCWSATSLGRG